MWPVNQPRQLARCSLPSLPLSLPSRRVLWSLVGKLSIKSAYELMSQTLPTIPQGPVGPIIPCTPFLEQSGDICARLEAKPLHDKELPGCLPLIDSYCVLVKSLSSLLMLHRPTSLVRPLGNEDHHVARLARGAALRVAGGVTAFGPCGGGLRRRPDHLARLDQPTEVWQCFESEKVRGTM